MLCAAAAILVFPAGFAAGFLVCLHDRPIAKSEPRPISAQPSGDAAPAVRAGVLRALQSFQAGYTEHNPARLDVFAQSLLDRDGEILVRGTDESNLVRGYAAVVEFVRNDWLAWGDLRLNLDGPVIDSFQDVAWVHTEGSVRFNQTERPLHFSAVLVRKGDRWLFREMQFQWDQRDPSLSELLHSDLYLHSIRIAVRKIMGESAAAPSAASRTSH